MRWTRSLVGVVLVTAAVGLGAVDANAQVLGTYRWRVAPYCNVITLTAVQQGPAIMLAGHDDKCGFGTADPVTGSAFVTGGVAIGNLSLIDANGTTSMLRFLIGVAGLSGEWVDDGGLEGSFAFNPSTAPGSPRPQTGDLWAYVVASGTGFHATSGGLELTHPATGEYCIVLDKRRSWKAAQVTLADPGGRNIVSVGTGHGSACNPLNDDEHNVVPVYVSRADGTAVDGNFTIVIPRK